MKKSLKITICIVAVMLVAAVGIMFALRQETGSATISETMNTVVETLSAKKPVEADVTTPEGVLQTTVEEKQDELVQSQGLYDETSIVLTDVSEDTAKLLAEKLGAEYRYEDLCDTAALYLPEGVTIEDVYENEDYAPYLGSMTPDYYVQLCDTDANGNTLVNARPNYSVSDDSYGMQTYLDYINLEDTWATTKGSGVTVAIIDTGIDTDHPEFEGRISEKSYNATEDKTVRDYDLSVIEDENGHGTNVAGVIAAAMDGSGITGIAPEVEIIVIKCADENGVFSTSDCIFGLAYAIECDADVVNMSFGGPENSFSDYTTLAKNSDVICVASAGNDGSSMPHYPAADENVIGVGALEADGWSLASYSNYGDNSDVLAPGTTYTTSLDGGYVYATGTSFSCPIVVGAIALYCSQNDHTEVSEMQELIKASSVDLNTLGEDWLYGFGALDVHALVCEEKGTITYEMLTDEVENQTQIFVVGHTIQYMPEPERLYMVLDGWFRDTDALDECEYYQDIYTQDTKLYANWINEDDGTAYIYTTNTDGTATITSYTGKRRYLTVPETLEGHTVTSIGEFAFANNSRLRSVILPETLTSIDQYAFQNCSRLTGMEIPEQVKTIGNYAFYGCSSMSGVSIVSKGALESIGEYAFAYCGIRDFTLPVNLRVVSALSFYGSTGMQEISVASGNSNFRIINNALYNSTGDTLLYYPSGLRGTYTVDSNTTTIDGYAFAYTRSSQVELPDGLHTIGNNAFSNSSIQSISFPSGLTELGNGVCSYCYLLGNVTIPESNTLSVIPEEAFYCCSQLKTIVIPSQIIKIEADAFAYSGLKTICFTKNSELTIIEGCAFTCTAITEIDIPDSVTTMLNNCFRYCYNLSRVGFGANSQLAALPSYAFNHCTSLHDITLPDSVTSIGQQAFYGSGLQSVSLGKGITAVEAGAFSGCQELNAITVNDQNTAYTDVNGVLFNKDKTTLICYPAGKSGAYVMPDTVKKISDYAFAVAEQLTSVTLSGSLTEIGQFAFTGCTSLQTPTLPEGLETIGRYAFSWCTAMSNPLTIPKNVISVGYFAYYDDYNLRSIKFASDSKISRLSYGAFACCGIETFTIPDTITSIGQEVFSGCTNLVTVTFEGESLLENLPAWVFSGADNLRQVTFEDGNHLTIIEAEAFKGLKSLQRVNLEICENLEIIDNYAFYGCSSLSDLGLPTSLKEIGRYAFFGCTSLTRLDIPENVTFIGRYAFKGTQNLNLYFVAPLLPADLQENWDADVLAYYMGVAGVQTSGNWSYALTSDGKASIVRYTGSETDITLTTIDGHEIVSIGGNAFKDNTTLQSITLPTTLQGIYQSAFEGTTNLSSIVIPDSVTVIDTNAFYNSGVSSVTFGTDSKLEKIGSYAFAETENLSSFVVPTGVEKISDHAFQNSAVRTVTMTDSSKLTEIGRSAFAGSGVTAIYIPSAVKSIGYYAFQNSKALTELTFGNVSDLMIYGSAFNGSGLVSIEIPTGVTYVGETCFTNCTSLTDISVVSTNEHYFSIGGVLFNKTGTKLICYPAGKTGSYTIQNTVTSLAPAAFEGSQISNISFAEGSQLVTIGYRAFYNCDKLTSISIPDGVVSLDFYAFAYCDNLETVMVTDNSQLSGIYCGAFYSCAKLREFNIPDGVQDIGEYAFYSCESMTEVQVNETCHLKYIGDYAFAYSGITEFNMPAELLEIGESAFQGAPLDILSFNEVIAYVGDYAFADCGLGNTVIVTIPTTVTYLGYQSLRGANAVENLTIPFVGTQLRNDLYDLYLSGNDIYNYISESEYLFGADVNEFNATVTKVTILQGQVLPSQSFYHFAALEEVNLPETLKIIGCYAFSNCQSLKTIDIPESVTVILEAAFECSGLTSVHLPNKLVTIGGYAFEDVPLTSIQFPETLEFIGVKAFFGSKIDSFCIPAKVRFIGGQALGNSVSHIEVADENLYFIVSDGILYSADYTDLIATETGVRGAVELPDTLETIESGAFYKRSNVSNVTFPASLKTIRDYAFQNSGIESVNICGSIEYIGCRAFSQCQNLKSVSIEADGLYEIYQCFIDCTSLLEVKLSDGISIGASPIIYGRAYISNNMFEGCTALETVVLPDSLTGIESYAFSGCTSLKNIVLPDSLQTICEYAFTESGITELYIPRNVKTLNGAFAGCAALSRLEIDKENPYFASVDGILYDHNLTSILCVPQSLTGDVVVPEGVTVLSREAFNNCSGITSIHLPSTLKTIAYSCFSGCTQLASLTGGENIEEFYDDVGLSDTQLWNDPKNWQNGFLYVANWLVGSKYQYGNAVDGVVFIRDDTVGVAGWIPGTNVYIPDSVKYVTDIAESAKRMHLSKNFSKIVNRVGHAFEDCGSMIEQLEIGYWPANLDIGTRNSRVLKNVIVEECAGTNNRLITNTSSVLDTVVVPYGLDCVLASGYNAVLNFDDSIDTQYVYNYGLIGANAFFCYVESDYWPEGWNYGIKTYYKDEWHLIKFYANKMLVDVAPLVNNEIVEVPTFASFSDCFPAGTTFLGWDINGDGKVDELPATLTEDIVAEAVYELDIETVSINEVEKILCIDDSEQLSVTFTPVNTTEDTTVSWSSDAPEIASVDNTGLVTALQEGTAHITATIGEHAATCTVTVAGLRDNATGITVTRVDFTSMDQGTELSAEQLAEVAFSGLYSQKIVAYDVHLKINGEESIQTGSKRIEFPAESVFGATVPVIYAVDSDGKLTQLNADYADGKLTITTEALGTFVLALPYDCETQGHVIVADAAVPETCTETGLTEGSHCAACGVIITAQKTIPATGHHYTEEVTEPTCTEEGYTTYTCDCGYSYKDNYTDATGHHYTVEIIAPTCTEEGYTLYTCTCGDSYKDDYTAAKGHQYTEKITAPTCADQGYTTYTCACGDFYVDNYTDATGHNFVWVTDTEATTESTGIKHEECTACHAVQSEGTEISMLEPEHVHSYTETVINPTCTDEGYTHHVCDCGDTYDDNYTAALGHAESLINASESSCAAAGYTGDTVCTRCGETLETGTVIPALEHQYQSVVTAPTCTDGGYTTYTCSVCQHSYIADYISALGHSMTKTDAKAPTSKATGNNEYYTCDRCHKVFKDAAGAVETTVEAETLERKAEVTIETDDNTRATVDSEQVTEALESVASAIAIQTEDMTAEKAEEALSGSVPEDQLKEVAQAVSDAVSAGKEVSVEMSMGEITKDDLTPEEEELLAQKIPDDKSAVVAMYLDIAVEIKAEDKTLGRVTQLSEPVKISVELSDDDLERLNTSSDTVNSKIYVARVHDGEVELIPATVNGHTLTFETDRFSIFSVVTVTYTRGDVTGDGEFNVKDLIHMVRYYTGQESRINAAAMDVNSDNTTNLLDIVLMLKKLCGMAVTLK